MRVDIRTKINMHPITRFYSEPSYVGGLNFNVYSGSRRQTGGSIFGSIKRAVVPHLKSTGKAMGKQAIGLLTDVAQDVMDGENLGASIKQRAKERAGEAARVGLQKLTEIGTSALTSNIIGKRPSMQTRTRPPSSTLKRPASRSVVRPPAKRIMRRPIQIKRPKVRKVPKQRSVARKIPKAFGRKAFVPKKFGKGFRFKKLF